MAINCSNRVVNIGSINLCLSDCFLDKKEYLKGITEQNGFIIFSLTDDPPSAKFHTHRQEEQVARSLSRANSGEERPAGSVATLKKS